MCKCLCRKVYLCSCSSEKQGGHSARCPRLWGGPPRAPWAWGLGIPLQLTVTCDVDAVCYLIRRFFLVFQKLSGPSVPLNTVTFACDRQIHALHPHRCLLAELAGLLLALVSLVAMFSSLLAPTRLRTSTHPSRWGHRTEGLTLAFDPFILLPSSGHLGQPFSRTFWGSLCGHNYHVPPACIHVASMQA